MIYHINRKSISDSLLKILICSRSNNFETAIKTQVLTKLFDVLKDSDLEVIHK